MSKNFRISRFPTDTIEKAVSFGFIGLADIFASLTAFYLVLWSAGSHSLLSYELGPQGITGYFTNQSEYQHGITFLCLAIPFAILGILLYPLHRLEKKSILLSAYSLQKPKFNEKGKFDPSLSGLRGLAAFGVILYHAAVIPTI